MRTFSKPWCLTESVPFPWPEPFSGPGSCQGGFKCQGDRSLCPCWLLREGTFGPEGWQIDHERMWSKGYDNRDSNCRALCATCHYRVTKEAILRDEGDESGDEEERD